MAGKGAGGSKRPRKPAKKAAKKAPSKPARKSPGRTATTGAPRAEAARSETSPADILAVMRQAEALQLRKQGRTFREIGQTLDVDVATAHRYVKAALVELAEQTRDSSQHLRALELARLDELLVKVWPFATGDLGPLVRMLEERQTELAEVDPKKAKTSLVAKLLEAFVDGIPQDDYLKRALNIIQLRSRLLGLEAPVKHAHTDPTGEEERQVPYAFPVPPTLDPAAWQAFAAKAAADAQGGEA